MAGTQRTIDGPGGRALHVVEAGDPGGAAVVVHHGTPGAGLIFEPWHMDAAARGIRLVSYFRPGYGDSTRDEGRDVADAAADVAAVLDALGIERCATWGHSGGGPHALACAALLGERVAACATLASVAPSVDEDLNFMAGMGEDNMREFRAAYAGEEVLRALVDAYRGAMLDPAHDLAADADALFSGGDVAVMQGPFGAYLTESFREGMALNGDGWIDDDLAFVRGWGFDPGTIAVPVQVWQGRQDRMVPFAHGAWLARRLPRVDARMSPDDGHLTLTVRRVGEVHAWLLERLAT